MIKKKKINETKKLFAKLMYQLQFAISSDACVTYGRTKGVLCKKSKYSEIGEYRHNMPHDDFLAFRRIEASNRKIIWDQMKQLKRDILLCVKIKE